MGHDKFDFTIGMACYENFDEVFFTVQSLRFHHLECIDRFEIILVDNNPGTVDGEACRKLIEGRVRERGRYIPFARPRGSCPPRGHLFDVARGRWVVCIDSHVMLESGALAKLCEFFDAHPDSDDLIQGPLVSNYGPHRLEASHMVPRWRSEMFGTWAVDDRAKNPAGEPFEIPQHGLGLFAARRESWLGFNRDLVGFSGGEGYIHEKYRQAGRRTLCLPGVRWIHKFSRPHGIPHRPAREDKIRNHVRGWMELGVDIGTDKTADPLESMARHYVASGKLTAEQFSRLAAEAGHPGYVVSLSAKTRGCVVGPCSFGSYRMRGRPLVTRLGWDELNSRSRVRINGRYDVALVVKSDIPPIVRERADRLIWEPMDIWFNRRHEARLEPAEWLTKKHTESPFDELIVSTIPMAEAAAQALPNVVVHLVPHHADPRVELSWYNPAGPVVYAGHSYFVTGFRDEITAAGAKIGREVILDSEIHSWQSLEGAALVLAPRLASRHPMNLSGKPTVKLANAAQAGIPALATPDPAVQTLFFDVPTLAWEKWRDVDALAAAMSAALAGPPSDCKFPRERWLARIEEIIG